MSRWTAAILTRRISSTTFVHFLESIPQNISAIIADSPATIITCRLFSSFFRKVKFLQYFCDSERENGISPIPRQENSYDKSENRNSRRLSQRHAVSGGTRRGQTTRLFERRVRCPRDHAQHCRRTRNCSRSHARWRLRDRNG